MHSFHYFLLLASVLSSAASAVYSGFCYGSHWDSNTPKTYDDFKRAFESAKAIKGAGVTFNSARLFSSLQWGSDKPSSAFKAAIDTGTTLLLGIWIGAENTPKELSALDQAFQEHGKDLADLVVGIAVGSEDIFRGSGQCRDNNSGKPCANSASPEDVKSNITLVRKHISEASYAGLLEGKPIGHVDIGAYTLNEDVDFVGFTAYPYWNKDNIGNALKSFQGTLDLVQNKAGDKPAWIAETGWPLTGPSDRADANLSNMQTYWRDVGCSLFGKHNVWWFELERDTYHEVGYDWGVIDVNTRQQRIDFHCPGAADNGEPVPSTLITLPSASRSSAPSSSSSPTPSSIPVTPKSSSPTPTATPIADPASATTKPTVVVIQLECVTIAVIGQGQTVTVTTNTFTSSQACPSPPPVTIGGRQDQAPVDPANPSTTSPAVVNPPSSSWPPFQRSSSSVLPAPSPPPAVIPPTPQQSQSPTFAPFKPPQLASPAPTSPTTVPFVAPISADDTTLPGLQGLRRPRPDGGFRESVDGFKAPVRAGE